MRAIFSVCLLAIFQGVCAQSPAQRAQALLAKMSVEDKVGMLHGVSSPGYTGATAPNPALGIPALTLNDGRQGFRPNDQAHTETAFPCQLAAVATFDTTLMNRFGEAMGTEFRGKGANVVLAPMLILARVPEDGRTFESIGEDPELAYSMARAHVEGVQSVPGVIANADDFVLNNQVSVLTSERAKQEHCIGKYLVAFLGESSLLTLLMCAGNKPRFNQCCV
jgi:beta-glucosidase